MRKKEKKKCLSIRTAQAKRSFLEQSFKPSFPLERLVVLLHLFLLAPRAHSFSVTIVGPLLFISFLIPSHLSGCSLVYLIPSHLPLPAFADLLLILHLCLTDHNIFYLLLTQMLRQKLNKASACSRTPGLVCTNSFFLARPSPNISSPIARASQSKTISFPSL